MKRKSRTRQKWIRKMWLLEGEIKSKHRFGVEIDRVDDKGIIAERRCGRLDIGATRNNGIRNDEMDRGWYVGKESEREPERVSERM